MTKTHCSLCLILLFVAFSASVTADAKKGEAEEERLRRCCGSDTGCGVMKKCCIQLCTLVSGNESRQEDGCCPEDDPCGTKPESGACVLCNCPSGNPQPPAGHASGGSMKIPWTAALLLNLPVVSSIVIHLCLPLL